MRGNRPLLGLMLGIVAVILFGGSLPATRLAVRALDPFFVTAARGAAAGLLRAPAFLCLLRRPVPWRDLPRIAVIALCLVLAFRGLMAIAMTTRARPRMAVSCSACSPIATAVAASLRRRRTAIAVLLGAYRLLGAALVVAFSLRDGALVPASGDLLLFVAVAICGTGYALSGTLSRRMPGWEVISWAVVLSAAGPASADACPLAGRRVRRAVAVLGRRSPMSRSSPVSRLLALEQRACDRRRRADRTAAAPADLRDAGDRGGLAWRDDRPSHDPFRDRRRRGRGARPASPRVGARGAAVAPAVAAGPGS